MFGGTNGSSCGHRLVAVGWQCSEKTEQRGILPATGAVRLLMHLGLDHRERSGGTLAAVAGTVPSPWRAVLA